MNPYSQIPFLACLTLKREYMERRDRAKGWMIKARNAGLSKEAESFSNDVDFFTEHLRMVKEVTDR